jgi:hypothetical protein
MGTKEYDRFPKTPPFRRVVAVIGSGAGFSGTPGVSPGSLAAIADATLDASLEGLQRAKSDEGLAYALFLLTQITQAARQEDFLAALHGIELPSPKVNVAAPLSDLATVEYDIHDLVASFTTAVDRQLRRDQSRTDIGEMAQQAAAESLVALCSPRSDTLFGSSLETVKDALYALSTKKGFATLTQDFFARLTRRYLLYHLSRELSNHVGSDRRFKSIDEHNAFIRQLDDHCRVCSQMVRRFAGEWYSKHNWEGGITPRKAQGFAAHAIDKMQFALKQKGADDGG